jgi:lipopolysaccharide/colanic/teichoic acid biosynthesis glycosyltransferase
MPVYPDIEATQQRRQPQTPHVADVRVRPSNHSPWRERARVCLDFTLALVLMVLAAPVLVLVALVVKLTSRGPVIYSQTRTGKGGRPYTIYKIRTMAHHCESTTGACWSSPGDPRITLVGSFLRRTHLDELPQLWNVLRGDMSLVGPRPERPEFVTKLEKVVPGYRRRLEVRPGVTGLAQIQLQADIDVDSVRRKLVYDIYYIDRRSLWLDLRIILSTACKVFAIPFALSRSVLQIPSAKVVENGLVLDVGPGTAIEVAGAPFMQPALSRVS